MKSLQKKDYTFEIPVTRIAQKGFENAKSFFFPYYKRRDSMVRGMRTSFVETREKVTFGISWLLPKRC